MKASPKHWFSASRAFSCAVKSIVVAAVVTAADGFCQERRGTGGQPARPMRAINYGNWVGRRVMTKEFIEKAGINEEQAAALKAATEEIEKRQKALDEEIKALSIEQARIAKKILNEPGAEADEIMAIIEKIGKLRTEQAKANTRILLKIRDTLTEEQRKKVSETIAEEGRRRLNERQQRVPREEREARRKPAAPAAAPARPAVPQGW